MKRRTPTWVAEKRDERKIDRIRRTMIGGTDLAPILGVSEKKTRFAVWAAKTGVTLTEDATFVEESEAGTYLEPLILRRFGDRLSVRVEPTPFTFRRRGAEFLGANPDGLVYARRKDRLRFPPIGGVDAKSRSPFVRNQWGEAGSSDVPTDELCQMQWYMEILDLPIWYAAVFFDRVLSIFVVHRDRDLGLLMVEEATAFWQEYVATKKEPPFEGPAAAAYLRRKYPHALEASRPAEARDTELIERREVLRGIIEDRQVQLSAIEGELKNRIGNAAGIYGDGWKATWSERDGSTRVDWKTVVAELRSFPLVADEKVARVIRDKIDETVSRHQTTGEPTRVLRVTFKGPRALPVTIINEDFAALPAASEGEPNGNT